MLEYYIILIDSLLISDVDEKNLNTTLDKSISWKKVMPGCYIVRTSSDAQKWYARIKKTVGEDLNFFICKVDISHRQGWLAKEVWDWIKMQPVQR